MLIEVKLNYLTIATNLSPFLSDISLTSRWNIVTKLTFQSAAKYFFIVYLVNLKYVLCIFLSFGQLKTVYSRVLILSATFDFLAGKKIVFWKYHKNTLCKILDDLKKLLPFDKIIFLKTQKIYRKMTPRL